MKKILFLGLALICIQTKSQTPKTVYAELVKQKVKHPEIVLAQSILETGWYKCEGCSMDKNNIFGLWNSKKQEYYSYSTWQNSVGGYLRGIQYKYDPTRYKDYYEFLVAVGYATDPKYIYKVKKLTKRLKDEKLY